MDSSFPRISKFHYAVLPPALTGYDLHVVFHGFTPEALCSHPLRGLYNFLVSVTATRAMRSSPPSHGFAPVALCSHPLRGLCRTLGQMGQKRPPAEAGGLGFQDVLPPRPSKRWPPLLIKEGSLELWNYQRLADLDVGGT